MQLKGASLIIIQCGQSKLEALELKRHISNCDCQHVIGPLAQTASVTMPQRGGILIGGSSFARVDASIVVVLLCSQPTIVATSESYETVAA